MTTATLGERLRAGRQRAGMSQSDLARECGIPKPRLSRYENDHIQPSIESLRRLASALRLPASELLATNEDPLEAFVERIRSSGISFATVDEARQTAAEVVERYSPLASRATGTI